MKLVLTTLLTSLSLTVTLQGVTQDLPDPTRPAEYQSTLIVRNNNTRTDWNLSAIRISDTDRSAIVNGRIVRVGDVVAQATVVDIQPVQVILRYENRRVAVRLYSEGIVKKQLRNGLGGD